MTLPKELTTVTPLSKALAMALFIVLPFLGFYIGTQYQELIDFQNIQMVNTNPSAINHPSPSQNSTINTTNWKTYTNTTFTFKYPSNWQLEANGFNVNIFPPAKQSHLGDNISIVIYSNPKNLPVRSFVDTLVAGGPYQFKPININGVQGEESIDIPEATRTRRIYIKYGTKVFDLHIQSDSDAYFAIFDQILSTFKFLE